MSLWHRVVNWTLKREPPIVTRHTRAEIEALARGYLTVLLPEIGIAPERRADGSIVWNVTTNGPNLGGNTQVVIEDATGEVVKTRHFSF